MSSPASGSDPGARPSAAFALLHPRMQRWVHEEGWTTLHDAQERAIAPILAGDRDLVICAATAAGKTEAAFLPICSALAAERDAADSGPPPDPWAGHDPWAEDPKPAPTGIQVLYLSPLKALINDQFQRLEQLCERAGLAVHRWHGDVAGSAKARVRRDPSGILLITPESLEATFVNRGSELARQFAGLRYVVVDELHSFLAEPRGAQLQSLLGRLELVLRRRPPRIGLSATLGDMGAAARFLRPSDPDGVLVISSDADHQELRLQIRGYRATAPALGAGEAGRLEASGQEVDPDALLDGGQIVIADHIFRTLRGTDNLVFSNTRAGVEVFADMLARRCEAEGLPVEFWPHHGSLAKDVREVVEAQLKDRSRPVTAICTSTLEMGIDIGSVASVAQIGPPPSVAALRQRLGRSGRRGEPAVIRIYVDEDELDVRSSPIDQLRTRLVQSIAMTELLLERWIEPPADPGLNLSTLIQQILSLIAQHGGVSPKEAHQALCGPGPFAQVGPGRFAALLRDMAAEDLIAQTTDGLLLHGPAGERAVNHYSFYTAFQTAEEWRLVADGRTLGSLPITQPLLVGGLLIFGGRRWRITAVDGPARVVELTRSGGGVPPSFGGGGAPVSDEVRARMVAAYEGTGAPAYLDAGARELLGDARANWARLGLSTSRMLAWGTDTVVLPWVGDAALGTLAVALRRAGLDADVEGVGLLLGETTPAQAADAFSALAGAPAPDPKELARSVENRAIDKWDWVLGEELSAAAYAARAFDIERAWAFVRSIASSSPGGAPRGEASRTSPEAEGARSPRAQMRPARTPAVDEFCVVDVETTGFSPRLGDRVIEVATVRVRAGGEVLDEWSTLVNPSRDIGATDVHGISAGDVLGAPDFSQISGDLLERLDGAVIVAHNLRFDWGFLEAEFARAGHRLPPLPGLCTLALAHRLQPGGSHKLAACCASQGINLTAAHEALGDARATGRLLVAYLDAACALGLVGLAALGCEPLTWPPELPALTPCGRRHPRGARAVQLEVQASYLAGLVRRLEGSPAASPDVAAYLDLLDRALEDRRVSADEANALAETAREWGLSADATREVHGSYLGSLCNAALADEVLTDAERRDLELVAQLLALSSDDLQDALGRAAGRGNGETAAVPTPRSRDDLAGLSVCFTGAVSATLNGAPITRSQAERFANEAGLLVSDNVTRGLDLLVVADPDTLSGKARKARSLGTRIMAQQVFWRAIGVDVD